MARARPRLIVVMALVAMTAGVGCGGSTAHRDTTPIVVPLRAIDGGAVDLRTYRGRVVVLHLFTTWSLAAQSDVLQLAEVSRTRRDHVTVIGIALDPIGYRVVAAWRDATRVPYLVTTPPEGLREGRSMLGRIRAEPTTVILGPRGAVADRVDGPLPPGHLAKVLARLVGKR